jgi:hypothetical protein
LVRDDAANPFLPCYEIVKLGGVFVGLSDDGVAHVVMPTAEEIATKKGV